MSVEAALGMDAAAATERVLARVRPYVEQETPSGDVAGLVALAERIEREAAAAGGQVVRHDAPDVGRNLEVHFAGRESSAPPLLLLAHIDTVHPAGTLARQPFRLEDGRVSGPGIYDMKTGVALLLEALTLLHERGERPRRPTVLLVTCDEEVGSQSARPHIARLAASAGAVLVPEPCLPDGGVKTTRKGVATYRLETTGRAGHAGLEPGLAVSAVAELLDQARAALELARHDRGTTINVGLIGGGTATNVVAAEAWAGIDVRLAQPGEDERVYAGLTSLRPVREGAGVHVVRSEVRPPLVRTPSIVALYGQARVIAQELGLDLTEGDSGGGSDGSLAAAAGAPTLDGLGPRGAGAHTADEHVLVEDLPFRLAFLTRLIERL